METLLPLGEAWRRSGGEDGGELAEEALAAAAVAEVEMIEEEVESRRWKRTRLVCLLHLIVFPHPPNLSLYWQEVRRRVVVRVRLPLGPLGGAPELLHHLRVGILLYRDGNNGVPFQFLLLFGYIGY